MRRVSPFLAALASVAVLCACAATPSPEQRLDALEQQRQADNEFTDMRFAHVENRLLAVEKNLGEVKRLLDNTGRTATRKAGSPRKSAGSPVAGPVLPPPAPASPVPLPVTAEPARPEGEPVPAPAVSRPAAPAYDAEKAAPQSAPEPAPALVADAPKPASEAEASATPPRPSPQAPATPESPKHPALNENAAYNAALGLYHKGQFSKAREAFTAFLRQYPDSAFAPNALYWRGECFYSLGIYDSAILSFKDVASKYPKHDKAAASLLKAGYAYAELNDLENARFYWRILLDDFPGSAPAKLARQRMGGQSK